MSFLLDNKKIELNNMADISSNITCIIEEMDLTKLSKEELLAKCEELGIKKCKSKNKGELIILINTKTTDSTTIQEPMIEKTIIKENMLNNISPLRYPGGKTRACKIIDNIITTHFDIRQFDTLCSPFFGGGSFEFYFQNKRSH